MSFQSILASLPKDLQRGIMEMDAFVKSLRPLKFKRTVDKRKINYVSPDYGVSYAILPTDTKPTQHFGWYFLHDKETKTWFRKTDYFVDTLAEIAKTNSESANRIFNSINTCTLCKGNPCSTISYSYEGEDKLACYGRIVLPLCENSFADVQNFFQCLNALLTQQNKQGES